MYVYMDWYHPFAEVSGHTCIFEIWWLFSWTWIETIALCHLRHGARLASKLCMNRFLHLCGLNCRIKLSDLTNAARLSIVSWGARKHRKEYVFPVRETCTIVRNLPVTQAAKQLNILSCVSKKGTTKKKVANIFLTKDRKMTGCSGYAKNVPFHTYWQPEGGYYWEYG